MIRVYISILIILNIFDSSAQKDQQIDSENKFRKSFFHTFFNSGIKSTTLFWRYRTVHYYKGDSLEKPVRQELVGMNYFQNHGVSFKYRFLKKEKPPELIKIQCYFLFKRDLEKYSDYYDSIPEDWKKSEDEFIDSIVYQDQLNCSNRSENNLCLYKQVNSKSTKYFLISDKECVQVKIKVSKKSDEKFLKKHNHTIDSVFLVQRLFENIQYCEDEIISVDGEKINKFMCYELNEK